MTLEEAKKILEKEGFKLGGPGKPGKPGVVSEAFTEYESPEICEAMQIVCSAGFQLAMLAGVFDERKERLKKEYEKNTKAPGPGEEQPKEKKGIIYPTTFPKADFYYKHVLDEGNPALKESASQFNDALLDEQAKKIKSLVNDITHMDNVIYKKNLEIDKQNQEITRLLSLVEKKENSISRLHYEKSVLEKENEELKKGEIPARYFDKALVDEQSEKIKKLEHEKLNILEMASSCKQTIAELTKEKSNLEDQITVLNACKKHNDRIDRKQIKGLGKEIAKLNGIIHDKNAILSDVAEELRLTKIREKNLAELGLKYVGENEKLKKELADKVVDKIDAQALKSAESALAWKEKVIADLTHELKAKHKKYVWYKGAYDAAQQILNTIADYAAKHPDKKISDPMVGENHPTEDNPEEIEIEEAVKIVRKAMKEGHTVTIDYKD